MNYPCLDGTILQSSPDGPVSYTLPTPDYNDGVYESLETSGKEDGTLQQIKIVRTVVNGIMTVVVTERTQQEIEDYFKEINSLNNQ